MITVAVSVAPRPVLVGHPIEMALRPVVRHRLIQMHFLTNTFVMPSASSTTSSVVTSMAMTSSKTLMVNIAGATEQLLIDVECRI